MRRPAWAEPSPPTAPFNWQTAARAPAWSLVVAYVVLVLGGACVQLIASPQHWFAPISHATDGLIGGTLQASAIILITVVVGVLLLGARLSPRDLGWRTEAIGPAVVFTVLLWAVVNLADVAWLLSGKQPLALHPSWSNPGVTHTAGNFLGQIFGNALLEETIFRGFLTIQLILLLRRLGAFPSMLAGLVLAEILFTAPHVLLFMRLHIPWDELWAIFADGIALGVLYLVTDNLFMAVGAHALANFIMLIFTDPGGSFDDHSSLLYIGLALVIASVHILRHPGGMRARLKRLSYQREPSVANTG
jgi:membrane protease YdiL (CAAX protease family)